MNDKVNEQISAWVDGELPARELDLLLARMADDRALARRWATYHLIGDALRNRLPAEIDPAFADRVQATIAGQTGGPAGSGAFGGLRRFLGPAAGVAIAASVAVGAVLVVQPEGRPTVTNAVVAGAPVDDGYQQVAGIRWDVSKPRVGDHLNQYLVNHNEYAARHGLPAVSAHVRVVSYDPVAGGE